MIEGSVHAMQDQETRVEVLCNNNKINRKHNLLAYVAVSLDIKIAIRNSNYLVSDMRYSSRTMVGIVGLRWTIVVMAKNVRSDITLLHL